MPRKTLADEVRGILRKQGPQTCDEIHAQSELANSRSQLANNLHQMSRAGTLLKERDGGQVVYRLPAGKNGQASSKKVAAKKKTASKNVTDDERNRGALLLLEDNCRRTQEALDAVIESLEYTEAVRAVLLARDVARDARDSWLRQEEHDA